jgi:hypothetical protein
MNEQFQSGNLTGRASLMEQICLILGSLTNGTIVPVGSASGTSRPTPTNRTNFTSFYLYDKLYQLEELYQLRQWDKSDESKQSDELYQLG